MELLHDLFVKDQQDAAKKLSGDQSHAMVMDLVADRDWYERLIVTPLRCKAFFGLKPTDREKAITQAKQAAYATLAEDAARAAAGSNLSEAVDAEVEALIIEGGKEVLKLEEVGDEWMKSSQIRLKDT
jgi:ribosomal protein L11 methylase PrmA